MNINRIFVLVFIAFLTLAGCKSKKVDNDDVIPAEELYNNGIKQLTKGEYKKASAEFEKIFFQHPGNEITPFAEIMQAYSLYLAGDYEEASDVLEIFTKLHPRHEDIAYAYYLRALANYVQISNVELDQSRTEEALESLQEVINRFRGSKYAIDAALKIDLVKDHLAGREMLVARYYLKNKNPIAAIKRFQTVIELYDTTSHVPEALYRLVESNSMLGLVDEARKYADVLNHNYPNNKWNNYSHNLLK